MAEVIFTPGIYRVYTNWNFVIILSFLAFWKWQMHKKCYEIEKVLVLLISNSNFFASRLKSRAARK